VTEYRTILDRFDGALNERFDYYMHHPSGIPYRWNIQSALHKAENYQSGNAILFKNSGGDIVYPDLKFSGA
jgi:hypothetical protein